MNVVSAAILLLALTGFTGASVYGDYGDTERGVCAAEGQQATMSLSHGGYVTRCGLPERT